MITFTLSLVALVSKEEQQQLREKYLEKKLKQLKRNNYYELL